MPLPKKLTYTIKDIYDLPEGQRAELVDGQMYMMAPPSKIHQKLVQELSRFFGNYIAEKGSSCEVYPAQFAVFLIADDKNYVEPDISIICDKKSSQTRAAVAPLISLLKWFSPSSQRMDYLTKLFKYRAAGVREYWIVNPAKETVQTYPFEGAEDSCQFTFSDSVTAKLFKDLVICVADLLATKV